LAKINKFGDLYGANPALPGGSRHWEQSVSPSQHGRQANTVSTHILPPLTVNSKSERKVNSLPPLGFELVIFRMLAHLSDHSAKSHSLLTCCTAKTLLSKTFKNKERRRLFLEFYLPHLPRKPKIASYRSELLVVGLWTWLDSYIAVSLQWLSYMLGFFSVISTFFNLILF
jgi:hypothetical protein